MHLLITYLSRSPCVRIVEDAGGRMFGLEEREVTARRKYVNHVRSEIEVRVLRLLEAEAHTNYLTIFPTF